MVALALAAAVLSAGGGAKLEVLEIQIYLFDRKSGEMAILDEKAEPVNVSADLVAIVKSVAGGEKVKLNLKVMEGKLKRLDETRAIEDGGGAPYEMFFLRARMLCAETTITATLTRGKRTASKTTTRHFACEH
jgi:hypothetical protein